MGEPRTAVRILSLLSATVISFLLLQRGGNLVASRGDMPARSASSSNQTSSLHVASFRRRMVPATTRLAIEKYCSTPGMRYWARLLSPFRNRPMQKRMTERRRILYH